MTSHDVVARCRRIYGQRRIGHAGTLDPDATGVLLVGLGPCTRLLRFLTELPKRYAGEAVLGVETSTLDAAGTVTAVHDMTGIDLAAVRTAASGFLGQIAQVPPMVSALKVGGRRLHDLARQGVEVDRPPRLVTVHRLDVTSTSDPNVFVLDVECSSGTYIRSLAADLGRALGGGAHLRNLRRTAIGHFSVESAHSLVELEEDSFAPGTLLAPLDAVAHLDRVVVDAGLGDRIAHGAVLLEPWPGDGPWAVADDEGRLLAVYERRVADGSLKPAVVLTG